MNIVIETINNRGLGRLKSSEKFVYRICQNKFKGQTTRLTCLTEFHILKNVCQSLNRVIFNEKQLLKENYY